MDSIDQAARERRISNAEGLSAALRQMCSEIRATQDAFIAWAGTTMDAAKRLPEPERDALQLKYDRWRAAGTFQTTVSERSKRRKRGRVNGKQA